MIARFILICLLSCVVLPHVFSQPQQLIVLKGGTLIDGTGKAPVSDAVVIIRGNRIAAVGRVGEVAVPEHAQVLDTQGTWIIPGLIDAHAHFGTGFLPLPHIVTPDSTLRAQIAGNFLRYGVTTVYIMADDLDRVLRDKKRIAEGSMIGPRIFTAGPAFTVPGSHPTEIANPEMPLAEASDDPDEIRKRVQHVAQKGVDYIKIMVEADIPRPGGPRMPLNIIEAVVDQARRNGLIVGCHCLAVDEATEAVNGGVKVLVHWIGSGHGPITQDFIDLVKAKGVSVIPTIGVFNAAARYASHPERLDDPEFVAYAGAETINQLKANPWWKNWGGNMEAIGADAIENTRKLHQAGVTLGFGTDTSVPMVAPGYAVGLEMDLMQHAGMTPMEILVAATQTNAKILGLQNQIGALAPGKLADLVILNADPLENVYNIRKIDRVIKDGKIYDPRAMAHATPSETKHSDDLKALEELDNSWAAAFKAGDIDKMMNFYAEEAVFFGVSGSTTGGRQEIRKQYEQIIPNLEVISFTFTEKDHRVYGDVAYGWMTWVGEWVDRRSGKQVQQKGRSTIFYKNINGQWRAILDHSSIPALP